MRLPTPIGAYEGKRDKMRPVLSRVFRALIVCPLCKIPLLSGRPPTYCCSACGLTFSERNNVLDFRIQLPDYPRRCVEAPSCRQSSYEQWESGLSERDDYDLYLSEIESVREVYEKEFSLAGTVLDVGGHQGRLRHFLRAPDEKYLSLDSWENPFVSLHRQPNLLRAYPSLAEPCNFVCAHAEHVPFAVGAFDMVHMRSVIDHFMNPYLALREAHRVLRPGGALMIGLHVTGGNSTLASGCGSRRLLSRARKVLRDEGPLALGGKAFARLLHRAEDDHHVWHPTYEELIDLICICSFKVQKVHWQKPPNDHVVYILAFRC
jgi:SAM-dependent methyltransferase